MVDEGKVKEAVRMILEAIGEDPSREGLLETPDRIARMYSEIFSGIGKDASEHLKKNFTIERDDLVIEKDIIFYSMCEHHLVPFYGKVNIAYVPNGKVAGLSKLARCVEVYARKPQLQERLTSEIADALYEHLGAQGVMVVIEAEHMCMTMRGVRKPGTKTVTSTYRGIFKEDNDLRDEVLRFIGK
ncbi:GTP cyclohydrolase I [Clostridium tetanomorphum]|uniref:GTP cyclohydrolase 1 n=1 Tax=Clostridium tetanomorphum TaxID=1553 RepID=A0A923E9M7_CLOTT|nr:GTP cyclohydrolase I FolE [Clostridium tetanomorphum]KAJ50981.1 GTP cyclohydrolase I [Clostridium tetanomorphum DSM 665]MBC2396348.1 GTP cyclohydrolase I FolE [Clostridium tetanomorphum]MBP1863423.1 GTP cyclohydrolase I [Clostridium tetanomorphum]NRS83520.1 GTP cyclohydrolase I [Clostridium tetanomorphum]NRZ96720.1 GTP cyclohydrolase I [Clostridium tetanomorphum]